MEFQEPPYPPSLPKVKLNIYDFCRGNGILKIICLGGYHSAVQVDEKEYKYEAHSALTTGVSDGSVNEENLQLIESIDYGTVQVQWDQFTEILEDIQNDYFGYEYDIMNKNCNHFSEDLISRLTKGNEKLPSYIFRATNTLRLVRCCIPINWIRGYNQQEVLTKDSRYLYSKNKQFRHQPKNDEEENSVELLEQNK